MHNQINFHLFINNIFKNKANLIISFIIFVALLIIIILVIMKMVVWTWITGYIAGVAFFLGKLTLYKYAYRIFAKEATTNSKLAKKFIWLFIIFNFILTALLLFIVVYFHQAFNVIAFLVAFTLTDILVIINYLLNFNVK